MKDDLIESLENFESLCREHRQQLSKVLAGWTRQVLVQPDDLEASFTIDAQEGVITTREGSPAQPDLAITGSAAILADLFWGDIGPTEPYMKGDLRIKGSEDDLLKVDFITLLIWGE